MKPRLLFLFACSTIASAAHAQTASDTKVSVYEYGYSYSPWRPTNWSVLDYRTKCEGEPVRGMEVGPIHWMIEFRNRSNDLVSFDYRILPPGKNKQAAGAGRGRVKEGKSMVKLAVVSTTRCDDGVSISFENVRKGKDEAGNPYMKPDAGS